MTAFQTRPAQVEDAAAIAAIYNQGIEDRIATFETEPRTPEQIGEWFKSGLPIVVVLTPDGDVVGYAVTFSYADRRCYAGLAEFSVYVRRDWRGKGVGSVAMTTLLAAARDHGLWKLLSRIFPENTGSLALMDRMGFRRIGTHEKHGKLDGVWRDCVIVEKLIPENSM